MKILIVVMVIISLGSCKGKETVKVYHSITDSIEAGDTVVIKGSGNYSVVKLDHSNGNNISVNQPGGIDSMMYYLDKEIDAKGQRDAYEIKYLKTGDEKYRKEGNKYADSVHYWYKLLLAAKR